MLNIVRNGVVYVNAEHNGVVYVNAEHTVDAKLKFPFRIRSKYYVG